MKIVLEWSPLDVCEDEGKPVSFAHAVLVDSTANATNNRIAKLDGQPVVKAIIPLNVEGEAKYEVTHKRKKRQCREIIYWKTRFITKSVGYYCNNDIAHNTQTGCIER